MGVRKIPAAPHLVVGSRGEEEAVRFLVGLGWRIVHRNWRPGGALRGLELDIVARDGSTLVFVEVKTRTAPGPRSETRTNFGFTEQKKQRLVKAAGLYLSAYDLWSAPCRFDLVCLAPSSAAGRADKTGFADKTDAPHAANTVLPSGARGEYGGPPGGHILEHYSNVIEIGHSVDSGNAAWQPW
ncbi:YraN family protein [Desulfovibrio sp. OttesenSCG-928-G15]|nr:YraN family protein [Desulfovibrio sp. OttesenSCG-928-G15]